MVYIGTQEHCFIVCKNQIESQFWQEQMDRLLADPKKT